MSLQVWLPLISDTTNIGLNRDIQVTTHGAISYTASKFGTGLQFNGSTTYLDGSIYTTATMTYMCWIYFDTARGTHVLDCRTPAGNGYQPMYINPSTGVQVGGSTSSYPYISYTFTSGTWYHIAVTYSPTKCELFINGSFIGENTGSKGTNLNTNQPFYIGCRCTQTNWFHGRMNDFRIYDHTCSRKEIEEAARGLFLHYQLNEGGTGVVCDCSGYKNNALIMGSLTSANNSPRYAHGLYCTDGASNYIQGPTMPSTCQAVAFWCKSTLASAWTAFADKSNYWGFFYYQGGNKFIVGTGAGDEKHATFPVTAWSTTDWNHVAVVRTGTYTKKLYINGVEQTGSGGDYYTVNAGPIQIFRRNYSTTPAAVNMSMVDFCVYVTQLVDKQIKELYNESVAFDKSNNIYAREFVESNTGISFKKTGQLISNDSQENSNAVYFKKTGTIKGNTLYEY